MVPYYVIISYITIFVLFLYSFNFCHVLGQSRVETLHQWKQVDFTYANAPARDNALRTKLFIPENCLVLDVDVWHKPVNTERILIDSGHISNNHNSAIKPAFKRRIFVTLPRFKAGVAATLATVSNQRRGETTLLAPFPSWDAQKLGNCDGVTSVYRIKVDKCGILWVLDSGRIENFSPNPRTICQPQVLAYDLNNGDKLIKRLPIPSELLADDSLLVTIAVDHRDLFCEETFLYIADVTAFKLIVYDVRRKRAWRVGSNLFYPYPLDGKFNIAGVSFNLMDGLLALALGPVQNGDRQLYFHSLASVREGSISTSVLRNESIFSEDEDAGWDLFTVSEPSRSSQSASEDMTESGVMIFGLLHEVALACWNSRTPYTPKNIHIIHQDNETLQFPSGMKIVGDTVWIMTSQLQNFIAGSLVPDQVKYRILVGSVSQLLDGSGCDLRFGSGSYSVYEFPKFEQFDNEQFPSDIKPVYFLPRVPSMSSRNPLSSRGPTFNGQPQLPMSPNYNFLSDSVNRKKSNKYSH